MSSEILKLRALRRELIENRDTAIAEIKEEYASKIEEVTINLRRLAVKPKLTAIDRYTEPSDAPTRYCKQCKEPLLRATRENAESVNRAMGDRDADRKVTFADLRRMRKDYCCYMCSIGEGVHSRWCCSILQVTESLNYMEEK